MATRILASALLVAAFLLAAGAAARADDGAITDEMIAERIDAVMKARKDELRVHWANGLKFEGQGGKVRLGLHGRLMADYTFFAGQDDVEAAVGQDIHSGFQFRRAWLEGVGTLFDHVSWMWQYGFEQGDRVVFLDVWAALTDLHECWGCAFPDVQVGHYQEPFGLAWLTPSKYFALTAWPTPTIAFTPGYNSGVTLSRQFRGDRVTARVGVFGHDGDIAGTHTWEDGYAVTGRFTALPWAPCDCERRLLDVGVSVSYRGDIETARFRTRADVDLGPMVVDTAAFGAVDAWLLDVEAALVYDRFTVQAEWMLASVDAVAGADPLFWGAYAEASWLFGATGRAFARKSASFGPVKVCRPLLGDGCCGWGALELAARFSYVDLDDGDKQGGRVWDAVAGLNWYLCDNARVMLNAVYADVENAYGGRAGARPSGDVWAMVVRFQVHW